jgi:hypothetical protein
MALPPAAEWGWIDGFALDLSGYLKLLGTLLIVSGFLLWRWNLWCLTFEIRLSTFCSKGRSDAVLVVLRVERLVLDL